MTEPAPSPSRWRRVKKLLPWASLAVGLASGMLMDRRPERAWLVAAAIALGWTGVLVLSWLDRRPASGAWQERAVRISSRLAVSGAVQFALFFTWPFYARAAAGTVGQSLFVVWLVVAAGITLWDPWHDAVEATPVGAALLHGTATLAGFGAMLPIFGMSNAWSLFVAALMATLVMPWVAWLSLPLPRQSRRLLRLTPLLALPVVGWAVPAARHIVPAAPLRLIAHGIGTDVSGHELVGAGETLYDPPQLVCHTTLWAPRGLRDAVEHVWRVDGSEIDRISVVIKGGRDAGFRTHSIKQKLGGLAGTWTCDTETASGQLLARATAKVVFRDTPAPGVGPEPDPTPPLEAPTAEVPSPAAAAAEPQPAP